MYYTKEELRQAFKKADLEDKFRTVFKKRMPQEHECRRTLWNVKLESIRQRKAELQKRTSMIEST